MIVGSPGKSPVGSPGRSANRASFFGGRSTNTGSVYVWTGRGGEETEEESESEDESLIGIGFKGRPGRANRDMVDVVMEGGGKESMKGKGSSTQKQSSIAFARKASPMGIGGNQSSTATLNAFEDVSLDDMDLHSPTPRKRVRFNDDVVIVLETEEEAEGLRQA
ncbi:hypothetical protein HK101_006264, partial [Irineochytrium annulatum]